MRVGPIGAIPALLRTHAQEKPEQILAEVGIDLSLFKDPENTISFVKAGQLLNLCSKRTGIPHFGLLVGQQIGTDSLGQLSLLAMYSKDAGTALRSMILHLCIHDRGAIPTLTTSNGIAKMGYAIYQPVQEGAKQICDIGIANICNVMRSLCGKTWVPDAVFFSHSKPDNVHPYQSFFRAPLQFDADETALTFPDRWLQQTIPSADAQQYRIYMEQLATIKTNMKFNLQDELRLAMRPLLVSGSCKTEHLAQILSMHPRTLNRRLKQNGTTLRTLVGETRHEIAKQMLTDSSMSIIEISTLLGYAEASVFTRAFRRWSGTTPTTWRSQYS